MKTKWKINKMLLLSAAMVLTVSLTAQQGSGTTYYRECRLANYIPDLTEEQTTRIEALRVDHMDKMLKNRAKVQVLRAELNQLEIAENADIKNINSKIDEISAIKNKMAKDRSKHRQEVRVILTPEQRVIFDSRSGNRRGKGSFGPSHTRGQGKGYWHDQGRRACMR